MEIYAVNISSGIEISIFDELMMNISNEKRRRILSFHRFDDKLRALIGDIIIRFLICKKIGIKNHEIAFEKTFYGKPYILNRSDFYFNLSHSGDWVTCAIDILPIGIDVEQVQKIDLDITDRFFSKTECHQFMKQIESNKLSYFFNLWTVKESYIKAVGKGLSIPLSSFTVDFDNNNIINEDSYSTLKYYFKQYEIDNNYKTAVCSMKSNFPEQVTTICLRDLVKGFLD